jgi:protein-disulfide isomerase
VPGLSSQAIALHVRLAQSPASVIVTQEAASTAASVAASVPPSSPDPELLELDEPELLPPLELELLDPELLEPELLEPELLPLLEPDALPPLDPLPLLELEPVPFVPLSLQPVPATPTAIADDATTKPSKPTRSFMHATVARAAHDGSLPEKIIGRAYLVNLPGRKGGPTMSRLQTPIDHRDHVLGPEEAPVTLVEYGDYECAFCGRAHGVIHEVLRRVGDDVRFAYRHFPLSQVHPHALLAAQAAEAAGAEHFFWEMHHLLFEHQKALGSDDLLSYADTIGLDVARFAQELRFEIYLPKVHADFESGVRSGVTGTPTFFINGERFDMPWDPDSLATAIEHAA